VLTGVAFPRLAMDVDGTGEEPPNEFFCPISQTIMQHPTINEAGNTYEYLSIAEWFALGRRTDPLSGTKIRNPTLLIPNRSLKSQIQEWMQKHPQRRNDPVLQKADYGEKIKAFEKNHPPIRKEEANAEADDKTASNAPAEGMTNVDLGPSEVKSIAEEVKHEPAGSGDEYEPNLPESVRINSQSESRFNPLGREAERGVIRIAPPSANSSRRSYELQPMQRPKKEVVKFTLVVIGDSGVGKSCLLDRYTRNKYTCLGPTLGADARFKTLHVKNKIVKLQIWDTAGQEKFR